MIISILNSETVKQQTKIMSKNIILTNQEVEHKIKRIAYQIYETFVDEEEIVIAGIAANGFIFAKNSIGSGNNIAYQSFALRSTNQQTESTASH